MSAPAIASRIDPETGEYILYLANRSGGPIVFGATKAEAMAKMETALVACRVVDDLEQMIHERHNA